MRRFVASLAGIAAMFMLLVAPSASAASTARNQTWDMRGQYTINFTCVSGCTTAVPHFINITSDDLLTGAFSGTGYYTANTAFKWNVSGQVSGDALTMVITYTGADAGYRVYLNGSIAPNGSLSGTATDSSGGYFTWVAEGTATRAPLNHGQFVSSYSDKTTAAQSTLGMPVVSGK